MHKCRVKVRMKGVGEYNAQMPRKGEDEGGDFMHKCHVKVRMKGGNLCKNAA